MSDQRKIWYKLRGALIAPCCIFIMFCAVGEVEDRHLTVPLGSVLFAFGLFLRVWAQTHLHYRLKEHKKLTLTGPYVYVRNPIYIGNTFILAGITVLAELVWFVPFMVAACAFTYHKTVLYEESHLAAKYGEGYGDFLKKVPRWMPRFRGVEPEANDSFRRFLVPSILAELHILLLLVMPISKELLFG
jgi:protein-S-isoprenylcysteine O-methyltransferase Ste14